ncbi:hypothetical protein AB1L42_19145 [Thalassoglobus sp. JC818]|uniref:hypothetical protein n=1 Tax=Thalassoglobus sp. JC818 TaxID=3232136 RepID=UPI00345B3023
MPKSRWTSMLVLIALMAFGADCIVSRSDADDVSVNAINSKSVEQLVALLDSPKRAERVEAERRLIQLGESAIPDLEKLSVDNPIIDIQLDRIRNEIRKLAATRTLEGTRFSFDAPNEVNIQEFIQKLTGSTGNLVLTDPPNLSRRVRFEGKDVPFWQVIDEVCLHHDLGWRTSSNAVVLSTSERTRYDVADYVKCVRIGGIVQRQRQGFRQRRRGELIRVEFRIDVEPQVVPFFAQVFDRDFELADENLTATPFNPDAGHELLFRGGRTAVFTIDFQTESEAIEFPISASGFITLFCAARREPIAIALDILQQSPDNRVRLEGISRTPAETIIRLSIQLPHNADELRSHRLGLLHRDVKLQLANGQTTASSRVELLSRRGLIHSLEVRFPSDVEATHLIYGMPELLTFLPVPFEIHGLERN